MFASAQDRPRVVIVVARRVPARNAATSRGEAEADARARAEKLGAVMSVG